MTDHDPIIHPEEWPAIRRLLGWSQLELANRCGWKTSGLVGRYENEWHLMDIDRPGPGGTTPLMNARHAARVLQDALREMSPDA